MRTTISQDEMTALARAQADKLRVVRRAIKPVIGHEYVDSVPGHEVQKDNQDPPQILDPLRIRPNQHLQPIQISRHFMLYREQSGDFETLKSLITRCAADLALAEDAVILLGSAASDLLKKTLHVTFEDAELDAQKRLWQGGYVGNRPILDSILGARTTLQTHSQYGEYYVIVSPALYEEAYKPQDNSRPTDLPIYQILPLLAKDGFLYSDALGGKSGVMFSLAQGTLSLSVPMDIWVDTSLPDDLEGRPQYKVGEQFRLVIDNTDAVVDLPGPPHSGS
jgi:Encapsulating protein for peroxidase